jgi:DNA-binding response OmpR family regulator
MAKILIVDDDPALREWLKLILRNQKHDVRSVETGEAFFAALDHQVPDIALVDVLLAGMNGMQIVKRLRAEPRTAALPVVMISMLRQDKYLEQAAGLGADDYLVKPLVAADVIGVVQARLAARQDAQASDVNAQAG